MKFVSIAALVAGDLITLFRVEEAREEFRVPWRPGSAAARRTYHKGLQPHGLAGDQYLQRNALRDAQTLAKFVRRATLQQGAVVFVGRGAGQIGGQRVLDLLRLLKRGEWQCDPFGRHTAVLWKGYVRRKDGKSHVYYSVSESVRVGRDRVVQRRLLNLGEFNTPRSIAGSARSK